MKICSKCKQEKDETQFNFKIKSKNRLQPYCKTCNSIRCKQYYRDNLESHKKSIKNRKKKCRKLTHEFILNFLKNNPCIVCGEADIIVLEFDHINQIEKQYGIANMVGEGYSIQAIQKEIDKCQVLCANCHRRKTHKEQNTYRFLAS